MAPRNLLYILDRYPTLSQTFVSNEIKGMRDRDRDVMVVSLVAGDTTDGATVMRHVNPLRMLAAHVRIAANNPLGYLRYVQFALDCKGEGLRPLASAPSIALIAKKYKRQHIHTHFGWNASVVARATQILTGLPRSVTFHAHDIYVQPRNLHAKVTDAKLVNVCAYNADMMKEKFGIETHAVVPCGVDEHYESAADSRHIENNVVELLSVGRLMPKKGFDVLLRALAKLAANGQHFHCRIIGEGPEANYLQALIADLQLESFVTLAGSHSNDETILSYRYADVFVLACRVASNGDADAQPIVLKEAMAHSLPVVTTYVTGIPELVDDTVGWMVEPGNADELADALTEAIENESERRTRGAMAQKRITGHTLRRQVDELLGLISA